MITFLFWNIQGKPLQHRAARLVARHGVQVLILGECALPPADVVAALNAPTVGNWCYPPAGAERLRLFTRLPSGSVVDVFTEVADRMTIREIRPSGSPSFLFAGVHLPSKQGWTTEDHVSWLHFLIEDLERVENRCLGRLVLAGDLNMDPFDAGVIGGFGLHALATRDLAERRSGREVQGRMGNRTFFNPMWRFLGDRGDRPSGTYYRRVSVPVNPYWHTLDQVLVRPEMADKLVSVEILDHDGSERLTHPDGGWPDADKGSDHLPLLFTITP